MAICPACEREYLDSYDACPFCLRELTADPEPVVRVPVGREPRTGPGPLLVASLTALASVIGVASYIGVQLAMAGQAARSATAADRTACYATQLITERAALVWSLTHEDRPVRDPSVLVPQNLESAPRCPSDGAFSFVWDPDTPRLVCSEHGWHGDSRAAPDGSEDPPRADPRGAQVP